jgi:hypothetical protein
MSDKPISVGDLVMIVKPRFCCGYSGGLGMVFIVLPPAHARYVTCSRCGRREEHSAAITVRLSDNTYCELARLKKIPPLTEPKHVHTIEELTA